MLKMQGMGFILQFDGFRKENVVFQMDVKVQVIFKVFQHGVTYSVGGATIFRRCVTIAEQ